MKFLASLFQSSVSHDPSEIILICWFVAQETFLRQEISILAFISRYSYLDLINNLEDITFCLNPPIFHVSKSIGTDRINID